MNVVIRADASVDIGSGHVMRCLTIANKLRAAGCDVAFWMERLEGHLIDYVMQQGFRCIEEAEHAQLYIVDHYGLGSEWERSIRPFTKKLAVIDDLARKHDCDLLLDQNVVPHFATRYDGLVPTHCVKLLGPKYLMMRDEFIDAREKLATRNKIVERLLVFMGGTDPTNETMKVLEALKHYHFVHVDVVVGNGNPVKEQVAAICHERAYHYHCQIDYMAALMFQADFAVGAGGSTLWERCYVALPSSSTIVADNQRETTTLAHELQVTINLGWHEQVTAKTYAELLQHINVGQMSENGLQLTATDKPNAWCHKMLELIT